MNRTPVNILFVGSGAIGCFYASRLHHPKLDVNVSLVARSNYPQIAAAGVHLTTHTFGDYDFKPTAVYPSVAAAAASKTSWDYIWVTTKALPDKGDDSVLIEPLISPSSVIVLIQNGVGIEEPYRVRFPTTPIVTGVAFFSAEQISPGTIRQNLGTRLPLGPYIGASSPTLTSPVLTAEQAEAVTLKSTEATTALTTWLATHGAIPDVESHDATAIQLIRWHKLAINAAINPSAILSGGLSAGNMARDPELHAHMTGVMREIWAATPLILDIQPGSSSQEKYVELAPPDTTLERVKNFPRSRPSMLQDWEAGRPLEVETILGNPVRIARERGVELPRTQSLYAIVRSMQTVRDAARDEAKEKI